MSNSCLENIDNLSELNYFFNKEKIANPKQFMKEVFEQNAEEIWNGVSKNNLFKDLKLNSGIKVDNLSKFETFLSEIDSNNPIFNFIK